MLIVLVLAPFMAALASVARLGRALEDFYGPRGKLAMEGQICSALADGSEALGLGQYDEADAWYRTALTLSNELSTRMAVHGWVSGEWEAQARRGLAEVLAARGRGSETRMRLDAKEAGP